MTQVSIGPEGTATIVLDGSGNGTAKVGPASARETWDAGNTAVSVATNAAEAQCKIYNGPAATPQYFRDGTLSGSTGDATGKASGPLKLGNWIWAVWTGGDPGSVATLTVTGSKDL